MEASVSRPTEGSNTVAAQTRGKPVVFTLVAAVVIVATLQWTDALRVQAHHDLYTILIFPHLFVRYDAPFAMYFLWAFVAAIVAGYFVPARWFDSLALWITNHVFYFAAFSFVILGAGAYLAYDNYPLALDEYAQYFQAQIFAAGKLHGQYPPALVRGLLPIPGQFIQYSPITGETMSGYWPGLPLLIAPFMFLGLPWVLNPLLGVIGIVLIRHLALKLMPETPQAAGWAMLFMLASPAFSVNASSYYAMNAYLTLGLAYAALLLELTPKRLFAAGVIGSLALVQHNPVPHTLFALPWLVWLAVRPNRVRNLLWLALGYLPLTVVLFFGWWWLKAKLAIDLFPANSATAGTSTTGVMARFLANGAWALPTKQIVLERLIASLKLYLWAVPGLALICFWGGRRLWSKPVARLLAWSAIVTFVAFLFVTFDQGHGWGYRYFHSAWGVLPLFGAAWVTDRSEGFRWVPVMGTLALISLFVLTPLRMRDVHEFITQSERMAPPRDPDRRQISFVDTRWGDGRYYAQDTVRNDPFLRNRSVLLKSISPKEDEAFVKQQYPEAKLVSRTNHGTVWDLP